MSQDHDRVSDLNSKITATQAKTAVDSQQALDFAHTARIAADEKAKTSGSGHGA